MFHKTQVLLCEGHGPLLAALKALLSASSRIEVIGEVEDSSQAPEAVAALAPDVAVIDIDSSRNVALQATQSIVRSFPKCKVLLTSLYRPPCSSFAVLQAETSGFILKSALGTELVDTILSISQGGASALPLTAARTGASEGR